MSDRRPSPPPNRDRIRSSAGPRERMLARLPVTTRTVDVDGIATAVVELGDGPPLLLLHGGIECGAAMWTPVLSGLARHHRVVAPDVPGLGESAPVASLDASTLARWLAGVIGRTGLGRPTVVAHSLIGSLVVRCATRDVRLVDGGLVVCGAPAIGPYRMPLALRYAAIRFASRPSERNAARFERFALLDRDATRRRDPVWFDAFDEYLRARAGVAHVQRTMRRLVTEGTSRISDAELARIDAPVALLWGRHDRMVPLAIADAAATRHGWPVHVIDDAGHAPHIEQPEAFVEHVVRVAAR